jgi:hypothetical protein
MKARPGIDDFAERRGSRDPAMPVATFSEVRCADFDGSLLGTRLAGAVKVVKVVENTETRL